MRVTAAGLELLGRLDQPVSAADERILGGLTAERIRQLVALLDDLRDRLAASPGEANAPRRISKRTGERER